MKNNNKKIAIKVTSYLGVSPNGAEPFTIKFFCEYLNEFGYEVELIGAEILPDSLKKYKNFVYFRYMKLPKILRMFLHIPISIFNVYKYSKIRKPDLIMCVGGVFYNGLSVMLIGKLMNITSLVRTAEDHYNFYKFCTTLRSKVFHYLINFRISKFVLRRSDYVLTTGERSKEYFVSKGIAEDRIFGIPGKIELDQFYYDENNLFEDLELPKNKKIVLFVGALSGLKGANFLPEIIKEINLLSEDYHFLIVGNENEYGSRIKNKIVNTGFKNIKFLDSQPREALRKIYSSANVLIFLCRVGVGYGQVTLEAAACDLPVLSLNPGIDVEWWLGKNCCNTVDEMVKRIVQEEYEVPEMPPSFNEKNIKNEYSRLFNKIL